jgi:hypothetical protein
MIGKDEIDGCGIDECQESQQHAPDLPQQEHHKIGHHEV